MYRNLSVLCLSLALGCAPTPGDRAAPVDLLPPAAPGSGEPRLFAAGDDLFLSWVEPAEPDQFALRFSVWTDDVWSTPRTIASGSDWFVNWADTPSIAVAADGETMVAHWLEKVAADTYAYGVRVVHSTDRGASWSAPLTPHDESATEHGFVSIVPVEDSGFRLVWLDGREMAAASHGDEDADGNAVAMTLRTTIVGRDGHARPDELLDDRVCDCCTTDAVGTTNGLIVAYRDRTAEEVRDVSYRRLTNDGEWTEPRPVHIDGWNIAGCPVNGPSLAAHESAVACVWFTMGSDETPQVSVSFSRDAGETFESPIRVDDGDPIGRADAVYRPDGSLVVSWMERAGEEAEIRVRTFAPSGRSEASSPAGPSQAVAVVPDSRGVGFPQLACVGSDVFLAWMEPDEESTVRVLRVAGTPIAP